jgi:hypothetical protein
MEDIAKMPDREEREICILHVRIEMFKRAFKLYVRKDKFA